MGRGDCIPYKESRAMFSDDIFLYIIGEFLTIEESQELRLVCPYFSKVFDIDKVNPRFKDLGLNGYSVRRLYNRTPNTLFFSEDHAALKMKGLEIWMDNNFFSVSKWSEEETVTNFLDIGGLKPYDIGKQEPNDKIMVFYVYSKSPINRPKQFEGGGGAFFRLLVDKLKVC